MTARHSGSENSEHRFHPRDLWGSEGKMCRGECVDLLTPQLLLMGELKCRGGGGTERERKRI